MVGLTVGTKSGSKSMTAHLSASKAEQAFPHKTAMSSSWSKMPLHCPLSRPKFPSSLTMSESPSILTAPLFCTKHELKTEMLPLSTTPMAPSRAKLRRNNVSSTTSKPPTLRTHASTTSLSVKLLLSSPTVMAVSSLSNSNIRIAEVPSLFRHSQSMKNAVDSAVAAA